jgi:hypothetical protein
VVAGLQTDRELCQQVQAFLLSVATEQPELLKPLGLTRFRSPSPRPLEEIQRLANLSGK